MLMDGLASVLIDEQGLVARAQRQTDAFADLYTHYFPRIYNYVRYRVRDAQVAEELTAQTPSAAAAFACLLSAVISGNCRRCAMAI
jgi:hypothetical protein